MTAPHNAPPHILEAMRDSPDLYLFRAANILGDKMTWLRTPKCNVLRSKLGIDDTLTCWSLDGGKTHATHGEIMEKAGLK